MTLIAADPDAIRTDLEHMLRHWDELPEPCMFEIRALGEGVQAQSQKYSPDWIDDAVEFCVGMNKLRRNIYAVRNPIRQIAKGSASDGDILATRYLWADCDDAVASQNMLGFVGPKWTWSTVTGTVPFTRAHTYWELDAWCFDLDAWRATQVSIASHFKSDPTVVNPSRIMRVAGCISWPNARKQGRGYVPEMASMRTVYQDSRAPVPLAQMQRVFVPAQAAPTAAPSGFQIDTGSTFAPSLDRERLAIQAMQGQDWHHAIIRLVASYVGKGMSDSEIHALTQPLTLSGYTGDQTAREVQTAIDGARRKGWTPEASDLAIPKTQDGEATTEGSEDWQETLIRNSRGRVTWNVHNAMTIVQNDENLSGCFAFDEFRQIKMLTQPLPFTAERKDRFSGREIRDSDITKLVSYFNRIGFPEAAKTIAYDVVDAVAEQSAYHPVRNYLAGVPPWDGVPRIDTWLIDYCAAATNSVEHAAYVRAIGCKWLLSAVARVMRPGCKADGVLILEGRQGAMKSTSLRVLCGQDWFGDSLPSMHTKDASDYLRGKWIIEMAELSNINKSEVEIVKAFIAREEERFRPAYGRNEITYPRQCVFAGSTNKTDYLRDETGNRRFWPVTVGRECDVKSLQRDRDMLWAEALAAFNAGETWWLTGEVVKAAEQQQSARVSQDAWEGDILQFLAGKSETSCTSIANVALKIEVGHVDRTTINRISSVLTSGGWARNGIFTAGIEKGRARFVRGGAP